MGAVTAQSARAALGIPCSALRYHKLEQAPITQSLQLTIKDDADLCLTLGQTDRDGCMLSCGSLRPLSPLGLFWASAMVGTPHT